MECRTRVLVHCVAGVSRSVTMVLAWLMKHRGLPLLNAVSHLRSARATVAPNESFRLALANYELQLTGVTSVAATKDPFWNFYAWNRVKHGKPKAGTANARKGGTRMSGRSATAGGGHAVVKHRNGLSCAVL